MPESDAERLETLLGTVLRMVATQGDAPFATHTGPALHGTLDGGGPHGVPDGSGPHGASDGSGPHGASVGEAALGVHGGPVAHGAEAAAGSRAAQVGAGSAGDHIEAGAVGVVGAAAVTVAETALLIELLGDVGDLGERPVDGRRVGPADAVGVTQQQLADRMGLDKSRVSRLCAQLEDKRLLVRDRDEVNRRNLRVRLTAAGLDTATRLRRAVRLQHERILGAMTPQERAGLLLGLGALVREFAVLHGAGRSPRY